MDKKMFKTLLAEYRNSTACKNKDVVSEKFKVLKEFMSKEFNELRAAYASESYKAGEMQKLLDTILSYHVEPKYLADHGCLDAKKVGKVTLYSFNSEKPADMTSLYYAFKDVCERNSKYSKKSYKIAKAESKKIPLDVCISTLKEAGYRIMEPRVNEDEVKAIQLLKQLGHTEINDASINYVEL